MAKDVFLFGTGRSGTTWIGEVLASAKMNFVFEPLSWKHVPQLTEFPKRVFLSKDSVSEWENDLLKAVRGDYGNKWTNRTHFPFRRRVVKFIRANFVIDWLAERFEFYPLYVIRNPHAVVSSSVKNGFHSTTPNILSLFDDGSKERVLNTYPKLEEYLSRDLNQVELLTSLWAFENLHGLRAEALRDEDVLLYDELVKDPLQHFETIGKRVGFKITGNVEKAIIRESATAWQRETADYDPLTQWQKNLSKDEIRRIAEIVEAFGLEKYLQI